MVARCRAAGIEGGRCPEALASIKDASLCWLDFVVTASGKAWAVGASPVGGKGQVFVEKVKLAHSDQNSRRARWSGAGQTVRAVTLATPSVDAADSLVYLGYSADGRSWAVRRGPLSAAARRAMTICRSETVEIRRAEVFLTSSVRRPQSPTADHRRLRRIGGLAVACGPMGHHAGNSTSPSSIAARVVRVPLRHRPIVSAT